MFVRVSENHVLNTDTIVEIAYYEGRYIAHNIHGQFAHTIDEKYLPDVIDAMIVENKMRFKSAGHIDTCTDDTESRVNGEIESF